MATLAAIGLIATVVTVAGGSDGDGSPVASSTSRAAAAGSGTPTLSESAEPSPTPTGPAPEAYQRALTALDVAAGAGFRRLRSARTPAAAVAAIDKLRTTVLDHRDALQVLDAPAAIAQPHLDLLAGLETLGTELGDASGAAGSRRVCAGSSANSLVSRSGGASQVRTAAGRLATADPAHHYRVGAFLPRKANDVKRRLRTGAMIRRSGSRGSGELRIKNGGNSDAAVSVVPVGGRRPAVTVYVRSRGGFTVNGVADGNYTIYVTSGTDWDNRGRLFTRDCSFSRFDDRFDFETTSTQFTIWTITLTAVPGGNATTSDVDPGNYPG